VGVFCIHHSLLASSAFFDMVVGYPSCYFQDAEVFDEGEKLELPVWRWLEIAGIPSLDER
jgi:hypothetical protein